MTYVTGKQYLERYPDVKKAGVDPLWHVLTHGIKEGRYLIADTPTPNPSLPIGWNWQAYLAAYKDLRDAGFTTQILAESHYLTFGYKEGRWPLPNTPAPTPNPTPTPTPAPGVIVSQPGREFFSSVKVGNDLFLGDYGWGSGGARIQILSGNTLTTDLVVPECESAFDLYFGDNGTLLCAFEKYAQIRKRVAPNNWPIVHQHPEESALGYYLRRAGNNLFFNYSHWDRAEGGVLKSDLNGENWQEIYHFTGRCYQGMFTDGSNIYLAGMVGGFLDEGRYPALGDISGNIIYARPDQLGRIYSMGCRLGNKFIMGNSQWAGSVGMIDVWENGQVRTTLTNERNIIALMQIVNNKIYAVLTYDWDASADKISELISLDADGENPTKVCDIEMPHVMGMTYADGKFTFCGGRFNDFGRVCFYKL